MLDLFQDCNFSLGELEELNLRLADMRLAETNKNFQTFLDNITSYIAAMIKIERNA